MPPSPPPSLSLVPDRENIASENIAPESQLTSSDPNMASERESERQAWEQKRRLYEQEIIRLRIALEHAQILISSTKRKRPGLALDDPTRETVTQHGLDGMVATVGDACIQNAEDLSSHPSTAIRDLSPPSDLYRRYAGHTPGPNVLHLPSLSDHKALKASPPPSDHDPVLKEPLYLPSCPGEAGSLDALQRRLAEIEKDPKMQRPVALQDVMSESGDSLDAPTSTVTTTVPRLQRSQSFVDPAELGIRLKADRKDNFGAPLGELPPDMSTHPNPR